MDSWDWPQFLNDIRQLHAWSDRLGDGWQLVSSADDANGQDEGSTYMRKQFKCMQNLPPQSPPTTTDEEVTLVEADDPCRCPEEQNDTKPSTHQLLIAYDFHVLFHRSYRVPVLCFNGYKPNGTLLTLDEAWRLFNDPDTASSAMPTVLTEMEHPTLYKPFHTLHPCRTAELLGAIGGGGGNRVLSFLSTLGPFVNLHMDLRYGQLLVGREPAPSAMVK